MKRSLLLPILLFSLFSCESSSEDSAQDEASNTHLVEFKIGNIYEDLPELKAASSFSSADSTLNQFGFLYYLVFDATGKFLHQIKQTKGDASFGLVSDQLKIGEYTAVLVSCTNEILISPNLTLLNSTKLRSTSNTGDIFYKKVSFNVTADGFSQPVLLERIIGCVEMRITDRIADNVAKIEFAIENEMQFFNVNTNQVETTTIEFRSTSAELTSSNRNTFKLNLLILNDQVPLIATVKLFDSSNGVIKAKKITGIQNVRRKKTILLGKMSDFLSGGFSVGYDDAWSPDSTIINF
ncbi:MAG: FimB/Mfa2 family fimbrial subunit [Arcticibacter sp.]